MGGRAGGWEGKARRAQGLRCAEWYGRHRRCVPAPPEMVFLPCAAGCRGLPVNRASTLLHACRRAAGLQRCRIAAVHRCSRGINRHAGEDAPHLGVTQNGVVEQDAALRGCTGGGEGFGGTPTVAPGGALGRWAEGRKLPHAATVGRLAARLWRWWRLGGCACALTRRT